MDDLLNNCLEYMLTHELVALLNEAYSPTPLVEKPCEPPLVEKPCEPPIVEKPCEPPLIEKPCETPCETPCEKPCETPSKPNKYTIFYPDLDDSLFWCMYVHEHGLGAYETQRVLKKNMVNTMMTVKRQLFDYFNKDTQQILKHTNHKITNATLNEIKCDLMTRSMSSLQNLIACCVYWKCTIVVELGTNVYAKFLCKDYVDDNQTEEDENTVLLYLVKTGGKAAFSKSEAAFGKSEAAFNKNKYKFAMETDKQRIIEKLHIMRTSWYKIDHYQKPIRAIGNYGLSDLLEIYNKICASEDATKMKKQEIYHSIVVKLGTMTVRQFV